MRVPFRSSERKYDVEEALVYKVLGHYGVDITSPPDRKNWVTCFCPTHENVNTPALRVCLHTGVTHCFSQCGTRSLLSFVADLEGCDLQEAKRIIQGFAGPQEIPSTILLAAASPLTYYIDDGIVSEIEYAEKLMLDRVCAQISASTPTGDTDGREYSYLLCLDEMVADIVAWGSFMIHQAREAKIGDPSTWRASVMSSQRGFYSQLKSLNDWRNNGLPH